MQWETGADHTMGCGVPQHDGPSGPSFGLFLWGPLLAPENVQVSVPSLFCLAPADGK